MKITLDCDETIMKRLNSIAQRTENGNKGKIFARALAYYDLLTKHDAAGDEISVKTPQGVFPIKIS